MNPLPAELVNLLNYSHSLADLLLNEQGEFYPFGAYLNNNNVITQRLFNDGDDFPLSNGLINIMKYDFDQQLATLDIAGSAVTYHAKITNTSYPEPTDVIIVRLNATSLNSAVLHYLSYQFNESGIVYLKSWIESE